MGGEDRPGGESLHHPGFDKFWSTYPRREGKGKARQAWDQLNPSQDLTDRIISAVKRHKESEQWQNEGGKYIPAPARYLAEERWEDELVAQVGGFTHTPRMPTEEELAIAQGSDEA